MAAPDPLRPMVERYVPGIDARSMAERVAAALADPDGGLPHRRAERHFLVWIPDGERKLWSPWLHLDVEDGVDAPDGSDAARLFGRFTPAPSLWTGFMLGCLALATLLLGGGLFAYSQWLVGEEPWAWWLTVGAALGLVAAITASRVGQARARHQIERLVAVVDRCA